MSRRHAGFTITDLTILIVCLIVISGLLFGVLSSLFGPRHGRGHIHMQNSTQIRGVHIGLVLFAQGNNSHYPGITSDGKTIDPAVGLSTAGRVQKLIDDNYFTQEYARNPMETYTGTTSYAMLKIDYNANDTIADTPRNKEWRDTSNSESIVISDRAILDPASGKITSVMGKYKGAYDWQGSVAWNDNRVTFEKTTLHTTKYDTTTHAADDLFTTDSTNAGDDALMVWSSTDTL